MPEPSWPQIGKFLRGVADTVTAATSASSDIPLVKRALVNVLIAADFPLSEGMRIWRERQSFPARVSAALENPAIRAWLVAWSDVRPLRAAPKKKA